MKRLLINCLMVLPSVPIVYGFLVNFGFSAVAGSIVHVLAWWGMVAGWALAVVLTAAVTMGPMWLLQPVGLLIMSWVLAIGLAGFVFENYFCFGLLFLASVATSFVAVTQAKDTTAEDRRFCRTFAFCVWIGLMLTLAAREPWTGVSMIRCMSWYMTGYENRLDWGNGLWPNPGAGYWTHCLLRVWPFALTTAWLAREYPVWQSFSAGKGATVMSGQEGVDSRTLIAVCYALLGAALGMAGGTLVWELIHAVGSGVVSDQTYIELHEIIPKWAAAAGACSGFAVRIAPNPRPVISLALLHGLGIFAGMGGGAVGWKQGLIGYFGVHAVAMIGFGTWALLRATLLAVPK